MTAHKCRCGRPVQAPGEQCTTCFSRLVTSVVSEALTFARQGRQVRVVVQTPLGTRVFARAARRTTRD